MTDDKNKVDPKIDPRIPNPARTWVSLMLGFGISVGVGLAPLLGRVNVPLFSSLLTLMPESLQGRLITLSTVVMTFVAVAIQFYSGLDGNTSAKLTKLFTRVLIGAAISLVLFIIVNTFVVERIPLPNNEAVSVVIGFSRRNVPPCKPEMSDKECLELTTLKPSEIEAQWGDKQIKGAELLLQFSYLPIYGCLGALVGILVMRQQLHRREKGA
jgi:hypothetical protein